MNILDVIGKRIDWCEFSDDESKIVIELENGASIIISDGVQSCCESRYMRTDDKLSSIVRQNLRGIEVKRVTKGLEPSDGSFAGDHHEAAFLEIATDKSSVTFSCHNEHNGYYAGIDVTLSIQWSTSGNVLL